MLRCTRRVRLITAAESRIPRARPIPLRRRAAARAPPRARPVFAALRGRLRPARFSRFGALSAGRLCRVARVSVRFRVAPPWAVAGDSAFRIRVSES